MFMFVFIVLLLYGAFSVHFISVCFNAFYVPYFICCHLA